MLKYFGILLVLCGTTLCQNVGHFWHVTDMHWDPTYEESSKALSCNPDTPDDESFGRYGNFYCDSPWLLINSSVYAMRELHPNPDFLIWTGDDTPHIYDDDILNPSVVKAIVFNLTDKLQEVFPDKIVYSALGNHDWSPKSQLPPESHPFYGDIADKWTDWFDGNADPPETFKNGGYYTMADKISGLQMIVLNTNLYYKSNKLTSGMWDPANQIDWLERELKNARESSKKVMIVAHVPPGVFEKHLDYNWYYDIYNKKYIRLLQDNADVIGSIHMAHHHTDAFRIVYKDDEPVSGIFLGPAVTPWQTTLPDVMGGAGNNPSIRYVKYNRDTGVVLDIMQYYMRLNDANAEDEDEWVLEYTATEMYGVDDMSPQNLHKIAEGMKTNDDIFDKYYKANGVQFDPNEQWNEETRGVHYCAAIKLDYDEYRDCVAKYNEANNANALFSSWYMFCSLAFGIIMIVF